MSLDQRVIELSHKYRPLAVELLKEAIRIPADHVDLPVDKGGDPACGLSNHEGPRLQYLKKRIVDVGAVARAKDVWFDGFGNLVWTVQDPKDGIAPAAKAVIYYDGHADTVKALRARWKETLGGIDAYDGLVNAKKVNKAFLKRELGYLPPEREWSHLLFGRGAADQLAGVVTQIIATKIQLELIDAGALHGAIVVSYATVTEEDNDGAGPMYIMRHDLPGAPPERIPDVVILSEGTGHAEQGACGIYRGQRGRMQIEVEVTGKSCHGSMPWEGLNPLEYAGRVLAEAADRYDRMEGFLDHSFLGHGTRTASWAQLDTPSDCAVPERFTFRFDRRLTVGESPEAAKADVERLPGIARAREAGLKVEVRVPIYAEPSWRGTVTGNPQIYASWVTPEEHLAITTAVDTYRRVVTPQIKKDGKHGALRREPRVGRWIFSTDGVGFPIRKSDKSIKVPEAKRWVTSGEFKHPAMLGLGAGIEQNTHKIGECVDLRELEAAIAFFARFPGRYAESR
ncbi:MAG: peptidase dimerization domain-containing protein [Deltaproteobacteria bacterium]|nr:peptidase dimerization domain-containing protein [Deltaproteobacteria bacterium]